MSNCQSIESTFSCNSFETLINLVNSPNLINTNDSLVRNLFPKLYLFSIYFITKMKTFYVFVLRQSSSCNTLFIKNPFSILIEWFSCLNGLNGEQIFSVRLQLASQLLASSLIDNDDIIILCFRIHCEDLQIVHQTQKLLENYLYPFFK